MQTKVNKRELVGVFGIICALAGYSGFVVGLIDQHFVLIGISILVLFQLTIAIFFPHDRYYKQQEVEIIKYNYKRLEIEIREIQRFTT